MMKKRILSLAVAAGLVGAGSAASAAMHINDKGLGEALIYPFYSAANGNDTYIHVVNTTAYTKAVKVRFIEAMNSQEVLDFNLYLSPEDEWAAVITANPNGSGAMVRTADTSCTVPELGIARNDMGSALLNNLGVTRGDVDGVTHENGLRDQPFVNFLYAYDDPNATPAIVSDSVAGVERTLEGYFEIIEMGQLVPGSDLSDAAIHDPDGIPADCGAIRAAWAPAPAGDWVTSNGIDDLLDWDDDPAAPGATVAGGLYGYGILINVNDGTSSGYDAVAIDSFAIAGEPAGHLHFAPGSENPSLNHAQLDATIFDGATAVTYEFLEAADAVSALLMSANIVNDHVVDAGRNALTDWVITMPTKRFYVNGPTAIPPFTNTWDPEESIACESITWEVFDREEANVPDAVIGSGFSPAPPQATAPGFNLCTEVSIVAFGDESAVNGSENITYSFATTYEEGWARMNFDVPAGRILVSDNGEEFAGLPVVGFAVQKIQNGTLGEGGVIANYAASVVHKSEQSID